MSSVTEDRFLWQRLLLAVLSAGFLVVTADAVLLDVLADPGQRLPAAVIPASALIGLAGLVLATLGGAAARIASGLYGVMVSGGVIVLLARHPGVWVTHPIIGTLLLAAATIGVIAIVVAFRSTPIERESSGAAA